MRADLGGVSSTLSAIARDTNVVCIDPIAVERILEVRLIVASG